MTNTRLLWLPPDLARPAVCLHLDADGRILARERPTPDSPLPACDAPVRVVVPGSEARALWLPLSARSHAQAVAEARVLAAPQLAGPGDDLHVAVAAESAPGAPRLVVLVERARLQHWLDRARALGAEPETLTPDHLMLPPGDGESATVLDAGGQWVVRAGPLSFSAEPALARQVLGDRPVDRIDAEDRIEALLATAVPAIDLLQRGTHGTARAPGPRPRRLAWLAAALALSPAVLLGAQTLRYQFASHQLQQQAQDQVGAALGLDRAVTDPVARTAAALEALRAPARFAEEAGALFDAVAQLDGAYLAALRYQEGQLRADVVHPRAQDIEGLQTALADAGVTVRLLDTRAVADGVRGELVLEKRP